MASVSNLLKEVEKLKKGGWYEWKQEIGMYLLAVDLEGIESGEKPTDVEELKKWNTADKKLTPYLFMTVDREYQYLVKAERTAMAVARLMLILLLLMIMIGMKLSRKRAVEGIKSSELAMVTLDKIFARRIERINSTALLVISQLLEEKRCSKHVVVTRNATCDIHSDLGIVGKEEGKPPSHDGIHLGLGIPHLMLFSRLCSMLSSSMDNRFSMPIHLLNIMNKRCSCLA
ncbi:hypothetical protein BKA70DRAFT_1539380 [Coprinopsis sp. MPI-PUGE-AT-0042]|nr:hypothetical protein BKA70DRAFT_1539380 [Coprinopsis sp. MPI-PUGE-AT-0042]